MPILQRAHSAVAAAGSPAAAAAGFQSRQRHCCWVAADFVAAADSVDGFVVVADDVVAADAGVACSANAIAADVRTTAVADYNWRCCCCHSREDWA
jgi:hypothetical protein